MSNFETKMVILAPVRSKKNSRRIAVSKTGKKMSLPSKAYEEFREKAMWEMREQNVVKNIMPPYRITYVFRIKGNLNIDIDNAMASINDVLEDYGVIEDDKMVVSTRAIKRSGYKDWGVLLHVEHCDDNRALREFQETINNITKDE
jgi:Holliday junction resolvase RusA-like endonuclease